ncbi:MAG: 3-hydroxylacyl-ACP dehydratase [Janthinobacterium lividum]
MCLLDRIEAWDGQQLRCMAGSHRNAGNPLRAFGRLGAACGIEYAAQAMALHGALLAPQQSRPRAGFLASVRGVQLHVQRLDDIEAELLVVVERFSGDDNHVLYDFSISANDLLLLDGRAAVILDAGDGRPPFLAAALAPNNPLTGTP